MKTMLRLARYTTLLCFSVLALAPVYGQQSVPSWISQDKSFKETSQEFEQYWKGKDVHDKAVIRGKGFKQFNRYQWFWRTRTNEQGIFDPSLYLEAKAEKYANFPNSNFAPRRGMNRSMVNSSNWTNLGPQTAIPTSGGAGRVNCIVFDPSNSNTIYIGTPGGGLWKTTNGGTSWTTNTDELGTLGVSHLAIDPTNTNTMYLATGDNDAGDTYSIGILKSVDGGLTWSATGLTWTANQLYRISKISINPTSTSTLVATTSNGIYRSTDAGTSWTQVQTGNFKDLDVNPSNFNEQYASFYGNGTASIYKSTNGGSTWTKLTSGLPTTGVLRCAVGIAPSTPSTVYAIYCDNTSGGYGLYGIYKSTNSGSTWTQVKGSTSPNVLGWNSNGSDTGVGQGWYDLCITVSPTDANTVYTGGVNIWKSTNGGSTWTINAHWTGSGAAYVHADHHAIEFLPGSGTTLFSGNDGGFFKTTNSGTNWTDYSNGLGIHQYYRISAAKTSANTILGGAQDNGTDRYNGTSWTRIIGGDGMECQVDYTNANIQYGALYYGDLYRTTTGGTPSNISDPTEDGAWVTPYVLHPTTNTTMYYATASKVYRSTNITNTNPTWTAISGTLGSASDPLTVLAVAPSNGTTILTANAAGAWKGTASGSTWTFTSLSTSGLPAGVTSFAFHPTDANTAWATIGGFTAGSKVYKTTNGGTSWTNISGSLVNVPANCVAVHPSTPTDVYIGTDLGIFYSADGGTTWEAYDTGLPNVIVTDLDIHVSAGKIRAATFGRGLWESPLNTTTPSNSVTVTAPNGGESLTGGNATTITWASTGTIANVKLEYSVDGGTNWTLITASTANDGSESWTVPSTATTQGRVRVSDASVSATNDMSNANFTITVSASNSVTLTAPNGGQSFSGGSATTITWTSTGTITNVKLEYSLDAGSTWTQITASTANDGTESWTVPGSATTQGRIRVSDATNAATTDMSDANFTITTGTPPITAESESNGTSGTADGPVGTGVAVSGAISSNTDADYFYFDVTTAGAISITLNISTASKDLDFYLYNASLTEVARAYTTNNPEVVNYTASVGRYYIKVNGYNRAQSAYTLTVNGGLAQVTRGGEKGLAGIPQNIELLQNYPNPFNPSTMIRFGLPSENDVTLKIYNLMGQEVRTLFSGRMKAGHNEVFWDGRNAAGQQVSSGTYIYRLQVGQEIISRRMNFIK